LHDRAKICAAPAEADNSRIAYPWERCDLMFEPLKTDPFAFDFENSIDSPFEAETPVSSERNSVRLLAPTAPGRVWRS
jgi:hypothetical protein